MAKVKPKRNLRRKNPNKYVRTTISITEELHTKMCKYSDKFPGTNWSQIAREAFASHIAMKGKW